MKKLLILFLILCSFSILVYADNDEIKVRMDGEYINFDVQPEIVNDRTMVPLRGIFETLGATVEWEDETRTVTAEKENVTVSFAIGSDKMYVNDSLIELDSPAYIKNDRTMVPLRAISESFNVNVEWREKKRLVSLASVNIGVTQNTVDARVKAVSHRGYHVSAPENSLAAYKLSRKMGFTYVETDIRFTKDLVPILTHEFILGNVAKNPDGSDIEKSPNISNLTYEQLLNYDFGIAYGEEWAGTKITTFEEFIKLCDDLNLYPYLDLKDKYDEERLNILIDILKKYDMLDRVVWCKYFRPVLEILPDACVGYSAGDLDYSYIDDIAELSNEGKNVIMLSGVYDRMFRDYLLNDFIKYAPVYAWTVNDKDVIKEMCLSGKVSGIYTDYVNVADILKEIDDEK